MRNLETTIERLEYLKKLEDDWDSYGAKRLKDEDLDWVINNIKNLNFLESRLYPYIFPTPDNAIQFEWDSDLFYGYYDIELLINFENRLGTLSIFNVEKSNEEPEEYTLDFSVNRNWQKIINVIITRCAVSEAEYNFKNTRQFGETKYE